nr:MAG TPA: hypothetical protein [Caudoviricetes sp.]
MADCSKTLDFLRTLKRYCAEQRCYDCPICPPDGTIGDTCIAMVGAPGLECAEDIIPVLQRWADEHRLETWLERLQRALPECDLTYIIRPLCPGSFFAAAPGRHNCPYDGSPQRPDCFACWRQEATDEL